MCKEGGELVTYTSDVARRVRKSRPGWTTALGGGTSTTKIAKKNQRTNPLL